jgi:hypothetical protein
MFIRENPIKMERERERGGTPIYGNPQFDSGFTPKQVQVLQILQAQF